MTLGRWSNFTDEEIAELKLAVDVRDGEIPIRIGSIAHRLDQQLIAEMKTRGFADRLDPTER